MSRSAQLVRFHNALLDLPRREVLGHLLSEREAFFSKKYQRAKNRDKQIYWYDKREILINVMWNCYRFGVRLGTQFGTSDPWRLTPDEYQRAEQHRIQRGISKFKTLFTYKMWFMSNYTSADYGTFVCSCCGATFHHSPSTIKKAHSVVYPCCCGSCTNDLIHRDHGHRPYDSALY